MIAAYEKDGKRKLAILTGFSPDQRPLLQMDFTILLRDLLAEQLTPDGRAAAARLLLLMQDMIEDEFAPLAPLPEVVLPAEV